VKVCEMQLNMLIVLSVEEVVAFRVPWVHARIVRASNGPITRFR
jgi:hypothetical protein